MMYEQMKNVDIRSIDPAELVDIQDIQIDPSMPREERLQNFIHQVKNPYCFRVGKIAVKVGFAQDGTTLEDRLENLIAKL